MKRAVALREGLGGFSSYQMRVLVVLTLVNFVNYIDRQILYPVLPLIGADFHLSHSQLGLLVAAFSIVHSLGTLPLGRLADRSSRKKVISFGILFWSAATFLTGLATSFRTLLTARALVGVGEAAYTPAATAIITGAFSREIRARVQGIFDLGTFIGGAVGIALGGILAEWVGWRPAFFIVGIPGLLLGLTIFRLPEAPRDSRVEQVPVRRLLGVPAYLMVLVGGWFITFAGHAYIIWGTLFVHRYKGFGLKEAGLSLGVIVVLAGLLGVMTGAALADRLARLVPWGRVMTGCTGFLVSAPLIFWALHTPGKATFLVVFFLGSFFMTWYHGPVTATIHDLIPPRAHATAMGLYYFFVNLFATVPAAWLIGKIADRYDLLTGMHTALAAQVAGGLCFFVVIYFIRRHGLHHASLAAYRGSEPARDSQTLPVWPAPALDSGT